MVYFTVLSDSQFMLMKRMWLICMPSVLVTTNDPPSFSLLQVIFGTFSICCFIVCFHIESFNRGLQLDYCPLLLSSSSPSPSSAATCADTGMVQSLSHGLTSSRAAAAAVARGGRGLWLWLAIVVVLAGKRFPLQKPEWVCGFLTSVFTLLGQVSWHCWPAWWCSQW